VLVNCYIHGAFRGLRNIAISQYGNLQIAKREYWSNDNQRHLLSKEESDKIRKILINNKDVINISSALNINGIIGNEIVSTIVSGNGIEPDLYRTKNLTVVTGNNLTVKDTSKAIIGKGVMQRLGVKVNDWVTLMTTTLDGAYNAGNIQIAGSYTVGNTDADNVYITLPIWYAQVLLNTKGIDKFIVQLSDQKLTESFCRSIANEFEKMKMDIGIKSWIDLATYYHQVKNLYRVLFIFMSSLVFILVLISILEIMSMAFYERMHEIGTIRAIGIKKGQVLSMLTLESIIIGILGGIIGLFLGIGAAALINSGHFSYTAPGMAQKVMVNLEIAMKNTVIPFTVVTIATIISAIFPAIRASRLNIVEILRHK
jgi:putative ABC transport system permease protein